PVFSEQYNRFSFWDSSSRHGAPRCLWVACETGANHRSRPGEQLAGTGDEGEVCGLASSDQPVVELSQRLLAANAAEGAQEATPPQVAGAHARDSHTPPDTAAALKRPWLEAHRGDHPLRQPTSLDGADAHDRPAGGGDARAHSPESRAVARGA